MTPAPTWLWALVGTAAAVLAVAQLAANETPQYLVWCYRNRLLWFQRKPMQGELDPRIYVGLPRSGKTLLMVRDAVRLMRRGVIVYSNLKIRDILTGRESRPMASWLDMLEGIHDAVAENRSAVFCWDEIQNGCDARFFAQTPAWWLSTIQQLGHCGVGIIGTAQHTDQIEKRLRILIGKTVEVRPSWLRRHLFKRLPLFNVRQTDLHLSENVADWQDPAAATLTWLGAEAFHSYSTRELIPPLDFASLKEADIQTHIQELTESMRRILEPKRPEAYSDRAPAGNVLEA